MCYYSTGFSLVFSRKCVACRSRETLNDSYCSFRWAGTQSSLYWQCSSRICSSPVALRCRIWWQASIHVNDIGTYCITRDTVIFNVRKMDNKIIVIRKIWILKQMPFFPGQWQRNTFFLRKCFSILMHDDNNFLPIIFFFFIYKFFIKLSIC